MFKILTVLGTIVLLTACQPAPVAPQGMEVYGVLTDAQTGDVIAQSEPVEAGDGTVVTMDGSDWIGGKAGTRRSTGSSGYDFGICAKSAIVHSTLFCWHIMKGWEFGYGQVVNPVDGSYFESIASTMRDPKETDRISYCYTWMDGWPWCSAHYTKYIGQIENYIPVLGFSLGHYHPEVVMIAHGDGTVTYYGRVGN